MSSTNMNTKTIIGAIIVLVLAGGAFGGYKFLFGGTPTTASTSPQGATGITARQYNIYGVALGTPGTNATSSSFLNNTGNDIYVTAIKAGCEGVGTSQTAYTGAGLLALTLSVATSSTAAPASNGNTNKVGGGTITIGTSTPNFTESTSTALGGSSAVYDIWAAGSYMTFTTNATNTAVCTFGVDGFSS